jgi:hypothetical protein
VKQLFAATVHYLEVSVGEEADMGQHAIENQIRGAVNTARRHPWTERVARAGFVAKGLVYITIGALAAMAALGGGGETTDTKGAIAKIATYPFGQVLLVFLAVGLVGYSAWRFIQGIADTEHEGRGFKALLTRGGAIVSGFIHLGLAAFAVGILAGAGAENGNEAAGWTAWLMRQPFGVWLVMVAGLVAIGVGLHQFYSGLQEKFREHLRVTQMSNKELRWAERAGKLGYMARGIVFAVIGFLLLVAASQQDPSEAQGLDGALDTLANQPYGPMLLGGVALGLVAYGLYMFVEARYRKLRM